MLHYFVTLSQQLPDDFRNPHHYTKLAGAKENWIWLKRKNGESEHERALAFETGMKLLIIWGVLFGGYGSICTAGTI